MNILRFDGGAVSDVSQKIKPDTLRRAWAFALPHTGLLLALLLVVLLESGANISGPLIYRKIINNGILARNISLTIHLTILAACVSLLDGALGLMEVHLSARISTRMVFALRTKLFEHIQQMPFAFFVHTQTGALVSRIDNDVTRTGAAFTETLSKLFGNLVVAVFVLSTMFLLSWPITLVTLVLLPLFIVSFRLWGRKLQTIARESFSLTASVNAFVIERFNVAGAQLARIFGRPQEERKAFEAYSECISRIDIKRSLYARLCFSLLFIGASLATAFAYGLGGVFASKGIVDVGTVVALVSFLNRLNGPLVALSDIQVQANASLVSFERVFEVLDINPMKKKSGGIPVSVGPASISFDHVWFRYPNADEVSIASLQLLGRTAEEANKTALYDITFTAVPGQLVALVGPSGAGKTTITQLAIGLYEADRGAIMVSGVNIRNLEGESLRQRIGVVTQDPHFFHDTIRANLQYAKPNASEEEIKAALSAAQILPLIETLPQGLDTLVGERGYRFSGGEKQRLAIARLLLKAPAIVVLDEATAHLDSESEAAIQKALESALAGRTSIVIAHRLSTILNADQILLLQEGRIVQRGTHMDLMEAQGLYRELYQRQFVNFQAAPQQVPARISAG